MVRIRLPSGNIREFTGSDELAQAIVAGEVARDAEIYHAKSGRWVPITGHPVFRRIKTAPPPPQESGPVPPREEPPVPEVRDPAPVPEEDAEVAPDTRLEEPAETEPDTAAEATLQDRVQEPASIETPPPPSIPEARPQAGPAEVPAASGKRRAPPVPQEVGDTAPVHLPPPVLEMQSKSGQELAAPPPGPGPAATAESPPVAVEPLVLAGNHGIRSDSLDSALTRAARQSGLIGFLETARLASDDSVQASRAALSRLVSSLTAYRARQQELSKVYNDSADALVLSGAWDRGALREWQGRVRRPEPPAVVARADALIAGLDSLLGLLHEYRGGYDITADQIRFKAPRASLQYDDLLRGVNSNRVSQSETISAPLSVLADAMAGKRFPPSAHD